MNQDEVSMRDLERCLQEPEPYLEDQGFTEEVVDRVQVTSPRPSLELIRFCLVIVVPAIFSIGLASWALWQFLSDIDLELSLLDTRHISVYASFLFSVTLPLCCLAISAAQYPFQHR